MPLDIPPITWIVAASTLALALLLHIILQTRLTRRMQLHLRQAKQEAQDIIQLPMRNPYPLLQVNANADILFMNPAAQTLFPTLTQEKQHHSLLYDLTLAPQASSTQTQIRDIAHLGRIYEQTIILAGNTDQPTWMIYCLDITERTQHAQQLQQAQHKTSQALKAAEKARSSAEKANQARGDFLANMSHELRTPMNGIIGLSDILLDMRMPKEQHHLLKAVNSSAKNLLIVLNDILDFSKIEAGELHVESIAFDLHQTITQVQSLQSPMADKKNLSMHSDIAPQVPRYIMGDPSRLQQILNNLVSNAIKFTDTGSVTLALTAIQTGNQEHNLQLHVKDTGIGIAKDKQELVFAKFQQAETSTARKYGGTGLGLAICKDLSELMGGQIAIESKPNQGTCFTVTLPITLADQRSIDMLSRTESGGVLHINTQSRMLIVDDTDVNLMVLKQILKRINMPNITEASNGKQALEHIEKEPFDMVLMDCQMPEMDGFEATRRIKNMSLHNPNMVVVAVTADAMKGAKEACTAAGMDDYISKPIEREKLYQLLQRWLPSDNASSSIQAAEPSHTQTSLSPSSGSEAIDWLRLEEFSNNDPAIRQELIDIFLTQSQNDIQTLSKHLQDQNYYNWIETTHKIFGASSNVGATVLASICDKAQALHHNDTKTIEQLHPKIIQSFQHIKSLFAA